MEAGSNDDAVLVVARGIRSGTALLVTSIVLACSFFIFTLGNFYGAVHLGLLVGCAAIIAFLADALVAPALLVEFGGPAHSGS